MKSNKIIYLATITMLLFGCSSEKDNIESKTYSFSSRPTTILLKTKERILVKFEMSWDICKPNVFWESNKEFKENAIMLEVYKSISLYTKVEAADHINKKLLLENVEAIKENSQSEIKSLGVCITKLKIT